MKGCLMTRTTFGGFGIRDRGGWYTVEKLGWIDTIKGATVLCSTGSLEHAKEYLARVRDRKG